MSEEVMDREVPETDEERAGLSRRALLARGGAVLGAAAAAGVAGPASTADAAQSAAKAKPKPKPQSKPKKQEQSWADAPRPPLRFFSAEDAATIGAMANRIFPKDKLGPGATDLGVVEYIDGQLATGWGQGERMYRPGPFFIPTDSGHGWQYAMTPADAYRVALDSLDKYTKAKFHGKTFSALKPAQQDKVLTNLETGAKPVAPFFNEILAPDFFSLFYENVKEGLFADPSYGGNRGVEGWKLIRYPGDPMARGDNNFKFVTDYKYYPPGPPLPMRPGI
jgi:gluconate 2-dehydrogenase gamma chain